MKDRTMKNWQNSILLGGIACLCLAFLCLDFRMASSSTKSEKNITTASMGDSLPDAMQHREKINLALVGENPLIMALQKALAVEMKNAGIGAIELVQGMEPRYPGPTLVVKVARTGLLWTPFFATSRFTIQAGYSSLGDMTFMREAPVTVDNEDGPALNMYSEYKISDRSWGIISRLGYYQALADYLALEIVSTLKDLYRTST